MIDPNIPAGIRSTIVRTFIQHLQDNPALANQIRFWQVFAGEAQDHDVVPLSSCPAIRVTYSGPAQYPATFSSTKADFAVNLELIIPGTNQFTLLDYWELIEAAIDQFGELDPKIRKQLTEFPVAAYGAGTIGSPAINHAKYKNPPGMVGTGTVNFTLSIRR